MNFSEFLSVALTQAGKNGTLANALGISESALSKRLNGEVGWSAKDIDTILIFTCHDICSQSDVTRKLNVLKDTIRIILDETGK